MVLLDVCFGGFDFLGTTLSLQATNLQTALERGKLNLIGRPCVCCQPCHILHEPVQRFSPAGLFQAELWAFRRLRPLSSEKIDSLPEFLDFILFGFEPFKWHPKFRIVVLKRFSLACPCP